MVLDAIDRQIINQLQGDFPLIASPFKALAEQLRISETEYLERIERLQSQGIMRRIAAVLRHREAGYRVNAMLVWRQDEETADLIGDRLSELDAITHLYLRATDEDWPYNMYAMVHARSEEELAAIAAKIADLTDNPGICMVKSVYEYKKVSMQYDL